MNLLMAIVSLLVLILNFSSIMFNWPFFLGQLLTGIFFCLYIYLYINEKHKMEISHLEAIDELDKQNFELNLRLKYLEDSANEIKQFKDYYGDNMKANMMDLTNKMLNQILDFNKNEQIKLRQETHSQINDANINFKQHFTSIIEKISFITKDFHDSKQAIDIIKKNIFNPIGAGRLTEISLENILRKSGLIEDVDFFIQKHISTRDIGFSSNNFGGNEHAIRPDAVVLLPNNHLVIIDAKACKSNENIDDERKNQESFKKNMIAHLKTLSMKKYDTKIDQIEIGTINLGLKSKSTNFDKVTILMFVVSEEMVNNILFTQDILDKCLEFNVTPVGPSSLLNILSMYKLYIYSHKKEENFELIIKKLSVLIESIGKAGGLIHNMNSNITNFNQNYEKFLKVFNENIVNKANDISELGIHTKNKIK